MTAVNTTTSAKAPRSMSEYALEYSSAEDQARPQVAKALPPSDGRFLDPLRAEDVRISRLAADARVGRI
jgi:hypothetical protein